MAHIRDIDELIARTALGDRLAFSKLYDRTSAKLFGVCLRVLRNRSEAEEVLQEVYVLIWRKAGAYRANGLSPMTWLITVARNRAIDRLRTQKPGQTDLSDAFELPDSRPTPEAEAIAASRRAQLEACLNTLDAARRDAVRGAYLEGLSYKDLAERHRVPLNTMRTWLRRSLLSLRACLTR